MFGSLISAVDPVATLAAFASVGVDPRVYSIIYGESILNDAVAIVFFVVFKQVSESTIQTDDSLVVAVVFELVWMSLGSVLCGLMWGVLVSLLFKIHGAMPPAPKRDENTALASVASAAANTKLQLETTAVEAEVPENSTECTSIDQSGGSEIPNPVAVSSAFEAEAVEKSVQPPSEAETEHKKHTAMGDAAIFFLASMASFYVAEALHVSGIISALFCGIVCNQIAVRNMTFEGAFFEFI